MNKVNTKQYFTLKKNISFSSNYSVSLKQCKNDNTFDIDVLPIDNTPKSV